MQAPEAVDSQQDGHATPGHHSCSGSPDLSAATGPSSDRWVQAGACLAPVWHLSDTISTTRCGQDPAISCIQF